MLFYPHNLVSEAPNQMLKHKHLDAGRQELDMDPQVAAVKIWFYKTLLFWYSSDHFLIIEAVLSQNVIS